MAQKKTTLSMMLNSLLPISSLNQGKAAQIIKNLNQTNTKIIVKNNEPVAAIMSLKRYEELLEAEERLEELQKGLSAS